jgi:hypothetical protein
MSFHLRLLTRLNLHGELVIIEAMHHGQLCPRLCPLTVAYREQPAESAEEVRPSQPPPVPALEATAARRRPHYLPSLLRLCPLNAALMSQPPTTALLQWTRGRLGLSGSSQALSRIARRSSNRRRLGFLEVRVSPPALLRSAGRGLSTFTAASLAGAT